MNQQELKRLRERRAIETLRSVYPAFPEGTVEDTEAPDFIVTSGASRVGIEVTEYFRPESVSGSPLQEQESLVHQITTKATARCVQLGVRDVFAYVDFRHGLRMNKKDVAPVAGIIADLVAKNARDVAGSLKIPNHGQLPECIDDVLIYRSDNFPAFVATMNVTWVPHVAEKHIQDRIAAKEKNLAAYRSRCSSVWLLIVVDGFRMSSVATLPQQPMNITFAFDRVILLHNWHTAVELTNAALANSVPGPTQTAPRAS